MLFSTIHILLLAIAFADPDSEAPANANAPPSPATATTIGGPPPGEGPETTFEIYETLIKKCDDYSWNGTFDDQPDVNKVYLTVAKVGPGAIAEQNLTKFISVFGLKIIADDVVPDEKLIHTANTLANVLDTDMDGSPDDSDLIEALRRFKSTVFIISNTDKIMHLMNTQNEDEGFPLELKFCPFAFDFEEEAKIVPGGKLEDATCSDGSSEGRDRTLAFVLDHLVGRGFDNVVEGASKKKLDKIYQESIDAGTFKPEHTGCPTESDECGKVLFTSWGLSTSLGFDSCWCEEAHALSFCDKKELEKNEPQLFELVSGIFPKAMSVAHRKYEPPA